MFKKKYILVIFSTLLLCAGFAALTQELDFFAPDPPDELDEHSLDDGGDYFLDEKKPIRWFRSNAGGMPLEEIDSRFIALRNEFALSIDSAKSDDLPEFLIKYYDEEYAVEIRTLYKNGLQSRTQWLFKDENSNTRLNAVFQEIVTEKLDYVITYVIDEETGHESEETEERIIFDKNVKGFIEIFDEDNNLSFEFRFFDDGRVIRTDYGYKDKLVISSTVLFSDENGVQFRKIHTDNFRYNRTMSLRSIERVFYENIKQTGEEPVRIYFPRNIMSAARDGIFLSERLNVYPEYFGDVFISSNYKMRFETDERARILSQTLYDEEDNVIWVIINTWTGNRIISSVKTEGDIILKAEFEYNSAGNRILERNYKNGQLERIVREEGNMEIEELYMNNILVLRAVWEDGRKISEARIRN